MDEDAGLPKMIDFMNGWARELPKLKEILVVRYEDLRRDTARRAGRILRVHGPEPERERA